MCCAARWGGGFFHRGCECCLLLIYAVYKDDSFAMSLSGAHLFFSEDAGTDGPFPRLVALVGISAR